jgi:PAS domain S-box-containing protein
MDYKNKSREELIDELELLRREFDLMKKEKTSIVAYPGISVINSYEKRIKEKEEKLDFALDVSGMGVWEWDIEEDKITWNKRIYEIFDIKKEEKINLERYLSFIIEEDREKNKKILQNVLNKNEIFESEYRIKTEKGEVKWIYSKGVVFHPKKKMTGCTLEITDRVKYEQLLLKSESRLREQNSIIQILTEKITTSKDFKTSVEYLIKASAETLKASRAGFWILNESQTHISLFCNYENKKFSYDTAVIHSHECPSYFSSLNKEKIIAANDVFLDKRTVELQEYFKENGITSMMDVPVVINGKIKGIVCHEHKGEKREWALDEQNFGGAIANLLALAIEVSERKKAEEQLIVSEKSYYDLFDNSSDLIYIQNKEGKFIDVNSSVIKKYGYSKEEIFNSTPDIFSAPDLNNLEEAKNNLEKAWKGKPQRFDWWSQKKDGEIFPKEVVIRKGKYFGEDVLIVSGRDISERKKTEEALIQSEEYYRIMFENNPLPMWIFDEELNISAVNNSVSRLYGYEKEFFSGIKINDLLAETPSNPFPIEGLFKHYKSDGTILDIDLKSTKIKLGNKYLNISLINDITEKLRVKKMIEEKEQTFSTLINNINYITYSFLTDKDTGKITIKYISPQVEQIIGFTVEEFQEKLIENKIKEHYHPEDINKLLETADNIKKTKKSSLITYRFRNNKTGKYVWLEESIFPQFDEEGNRIANFGIAKDVTNRINAEQVLRDSEENYRNLFENNMAGVFRTRANGNIIDCNKAFVKIFGFRSVEEVKSMNSSDFYFTKKEREDYLNKLRNEKVIYNYQLRNKKSNGEVVWVLCNVSLIETDKGEELLGTLIDVTEQKLTQETLAESEEKFRTLSELAPVGIFLANEKGVPVYINRKLESLIGISLEEAYDRSWVNVIHNEDAQRVLGGVNTAIEKKVAYSDEFRVYDNQKLKWVKFNSTPSINPRGEAVGWIGTVEDITTAKQAEERLKESENRFKLLSEVAIEGIVLTERGRIIDSNDRFYKMHGYKNKTEVLGKKLTDFVAEDYRDSLSYIIENETANQEESKGLKKDGTEIFLESRGFTIPYYGKKIRVSVLYDITERKKIENSLKDNERALSTLMNNLPGMAYRCINNTNWDMVFVSQGCVELTGYTQSDFVKKGKSYNSIVLAEDKERLWKSVQHALKNKTTYELEYKIITASGQEKWVWEQGEGIFNDEGKVLYLEGFIADISDRKNFERYMRQSRKSFKNLVEFSPVGVLLLQKERVIFTNPQIRNLLNIPAQEKLENNTLFDFILPEYHDEVKEKLNKVRNGDKINFTEIKIKRPDGKIIYIETTGILTNFLGKPAIQVVCHDISYRKELQKEQLRAEIAEETNKKLQQEISVRIKTEKKLLQTQKFTRSIIDSSLDMICATDRDGNIIEFNEAAEEAFGYTFEEIKGCPTRILYEHRQEYFKVNKIIKETGRYTGEITNVRKNGELFNTFLSASVLINEDGELIGSMGVSRDITDIKQAEERKETQYAISRILSEAPDFEEAAPAILSAISFGLGMDYGEYWEIDSVNNKLYNKFSWPNHNSKIKGIKKFQKLRGRLLFDKGQGLVGKTWAENKPIWFSDASLDKVSEKIEEADAIGLQSAFSFPVKHGKRVLGGINFFSSRNFSPTAEFLNIMSSIGIQVGQFVVRKKAEEELKISEERFKALFNQAAIGIAKVGLDGKFLQPNNRLCEIIGYPKEVLTKKTFQDITHPEDLFNSIDYLKRLLNYEIEGFTTHKRYLHKNGSILYVNLTVSLVKNSDGNPDYFVSVFEDITSRKQSEEKIFEQAAKLTSIFESSTHMIWTLNKNFEITSFNLNYKKTIRTFFGMDINLQDNAMEIARSAFDKNTFDQMHNYYTSAISGNRQHFEMQFYNTEGKALWLETYLSPIVLGNGKIEEISCIAQDITEKKLAESRIKNSLKEKEVLLKEVHHRVKNNLQVISSILNLQSGYIKDSKTLEILKESQNRIKSMAFIHESLYQTKDFSKINFSEYIANLSENLVHSYEIYNNYIELKLNIEQVYLNLDLAIPCGLILNELVSNSLKYAFPKNRKGEVRIDIKVKKNEIMMSVSDNGIGLPKNLDIAKSDTLGLQLVHALTEQLDGNIKMKSAYNKGTTFKINFNYIKNKQNV